MGITECWRVLQQKVWDGNYRVLNCYNKKYQMGITQCWRVLQQKVWDGNYRVLKSVTTKNIRWELPSAEECYNKNYEMGIIECWRVLQQKVWEGIRCRKTRNACTVLTAKNLKWPRGSLWDEVILKLMLLRGTPNEIINFVITFRFNFLCYTYSIFETSNCPTTQALSLKWKQLESTTSVLATC